MIHPTFRNFNRIFLLLFEAGDDPTRDTFDEYYMLTVEIQGISVLFDNNEYFHQPIKSKQEANEKLVEMSRTNDCTTRNIFNYIFKNAIN